MPRVAFILVSVIVAAVAIVALRGPRDIAGRPWYASQLDSVEFAEVETDWQYGDTVSYPPATSPVKVQRSNDDPESAGVVAPIRPVEPIVPITEPGDDLATPRSGDAATEVVPLPSFPDASDSELPVRPDLRRFPPIDDATDSSELNPTNEQPPAPLFSGPNQGEVVIDPPDAPPWVIEDPANESPPIPGPAVERPVAGDAGDEPPLPPADANSLENGDPSDLAQTPIDTRDVAFHAAEAIEFRVPNGWRTIETAFGRELRLVVLPPGAEAKADMPTDGVWLSYHVRPYPRDPERDEVLQMLDARMKLAFPSGEADSELVEETISELPGVSRAFLFQGSQSADSKIGFHMLIGAKHGIVEIHAVSSLDASQDREVAWQEIINSLVISAPQISDEEPAPQALDAKRVFGSWKSMRSSLRFYPDGVVSIIADPKRGISLDGSSPESQPEKVTGRYQAQDDLIMVKWDDGSLLNYRWKRDGVRLLMTDSEGRISQLRRFYQ